MLNMLLAGFVLLDSPYTQVEQAIGQSFGDLKNYNIELRSFKNDTSDYFFYTDVEKAWKSSRFRTYVIYYNERILESELSPEALEAILVHELQHIEDYTQMNFFELAWLAFRYEVLGSEDLIIEFERDTDRRVVEKGYGKGLIQYRKWLYKNLKAEEIELKKKTYLTPEEISSMDYP
jgi:hypothetical protein